MLDPLPIKPVKYNSKPGLSLVHGLFIMFATASLGILLARWAISYVGEEEIDLLHTEGVDPSDHWKLFLIRLSLAIQNFCWFGLAGLMWARMETKRTFRTLRMTRMPDRMQIIIACLIMVCCLPFVEYILLTPEQFDLPSSLDWLEEKIVNAEDKTINLEILLMEDLTFLGLLSNVLVFALVPALAEEIFFRGFLLSTFRRCGFNLHAAVWVSAIIFSFIHMQFLGFFSRLFLGAILGYLYIYSGSLWVSIAAHFTTNFVNLGIAFLIFDGAFGEINLDEKFGFPWYVVALSILLSLVLLQLFFRRGRFLVAQLNS